MMISLREYAEKNGKDIRAVRRKARSGGFKTAVIIGRDWIIDSEEPWLNLHTIEGRNKFKELYGEEK